MHTMHTHMRKWASKWANRRKRSSAFVIWFVSFSMFGALLRNSKFNISSINEWKQTNTNHKYPHSHTHSGMLKWSSWVKNRHLISYSSYSQAKKNFNFDEEKNRVKWFSNHLNDALIVRYQSAKKFFYLFHWIHQNYAKNVCY